MSEDDKEAKKEELLEKQEARQLTEEELAQVSGGRDPGVLLPVRVVPGDGHELIPLGSEGPAL